MQVPTAALLIIGDEILSGRTEDKNLAYLAKWLNDRGMELKEVRVVPDVEADIADAVNTLRARYDWLFTTGGIGPTHDDITVPSIAAAFGVKVVFHPEAIAMLEHYYGKDQVTDARKMMARVPEGASLIPNPISSAPGIRIENVLILAGIPGVMRGMLEGLRETMQVGTPMMQASVTAFVSESEIAAGLSVIQDAHPETRIGSYPFFRDHKIGTSLVVRCRTREPLLAALAEVRALLLSKGELIAEETL